MKHTDFVFNDKIYALSFTAEALFTVYDKFGVGDILETTHCMEPTAEGWKNCCWLAALMASQGELIRRRQGYDRSPMLEMEDLRLGFMAADSLDLRIAVRAALEQGFHRDAAEDEAEEVNLVLQAREEAEKKAAEAAAKGLLSWLRQLPSSIFPQPKP